MYNRVAVIGGPGSGKTTLSDKLSKLWNIPVTHIDGIHHLPNWQIRDKDERDAMILDIVKNEKWIIDGNYKATLQKRLEAADLVIWLDYPTRTMIKGILKYLDISIHIGLSPISHFLSKYNLGITLKTDSLIIVVNVPIFNPSVKE